MRAMCLISLLFLIPCAGLAVAPTAEASRGVRDPAHFFSDDAVRQADAAIQTINQDHQHDLLIETFSEIPKELQEQLQTQGKEKFFASWTARRFKDQGVKGVYVLICRNPAHLQVAVGNNTARGLFTIADRDELTRQLLAHFRARQYDAGLLDAVQFVSKQMADHDKKPDDGRLNSSAGTARPLAIKQTGIGDHP